MAVSLLSYFLQMANYNILLVEDDKNLGYILKEYLMLNHFNVTWINDSLDVIAILKNESFDLCVLDVMMPKQDGFTLASEIRHMFPQQPIIFLTARTLKVDKLKGFKIGADDYITKPVDEEELVARINAVITRTTRTVLELEAVISVGTFLFDTLNLCLTRDGKIFHLSSREGDVLKLLASTAGRLVERKKILNELWGTNDYFTGRSMDVIISRLRKYLRPDPSIAIITVHGKGFILKTV
jgi:DNA-binding response OmpR family regulator